MDRNTLILVGDRTGRNGLRCLEEIQQRGPGDEDSCNMWTVEFWARLTSRARGSFFSLQSLKHRLHLEAQYRYVNLLLGRRQGHLKQSNLEHEDKNGILFGNAPYHVVDHRHFIAELLTRLQALRATNSAISKLHVALREDTIIVDVNGPAFDIAEIKKLPLDRLMVLGYRGCSSTSHGLDTDLYHRCVKLRETSISGFRLPAETRSAERTPWTHRASRVRTYALRHMASIDLRTWILSTTNLMVTTVNPVDHQGKRTINREGPCPT